jgi:hypothetical protein
VDHSRAAAYIFRRTASKFLRQREVHLQRLADAQLFSTGEVKPALGKVERLTDEFRAGHRRAGSGNFAIGLGFFRVVFVPVRSNAKTERYRTGFSWRVAAFIGRHNVPPASLSNGRQTSEEGFVQDHTAPALRQEF